MKKQAIILLSLIIGSGSVYASNIHAAHSNIEKESISSESYHYKEKNKESTEHTKNIKEYQNNSCMKRGYEMIEEFNRLMSIPKGETALLSEELKKSEVWLDLEDDEKKLLAKFLFKTNKTEDKKTQIKFKKELIKSIMEKCNGIK